MGKAILVCGYGPGISDALASRFGAEGFAVGLVARNAERLTAGVKSLESKGVRAAAFPTDLGDPAAARALVGRARDALGPLSVVEWNAYTSGAGDLLTADPAVIRAQLDVAVVSLVAVVQAALPDLKTQKGAAVLVINGGLGYFDLEEDLAAVRWNSMGLSVSNAAKHKLVGVLSQKLKGDGVYVGEAMVMGAVKGPAAGPSATIEPRTVADKLWEMYRARAEVTAQIR